MSFFKYFREGMDSDGDKLWWPGGPDGFPFRGSRPPTLADHEYQDMQPTLKFRHKTFYLSKKEDEQLYATVSDKCANGLFIKLDKDRAWDEGTNDYRIYLEWVEPAYELPPPQAGVKDAVKDYTEKESFSANLPIGRLAGVRKNGGW